MKDQSILIENICNSVLRRGKEEEAITTEKKQEKLYIIYQKQNLTDSLKQLIEKILNIT